MDLWFIAFLIVGAISLLTVTGAMFARSTEARTGGIIGLLVAGFLLFMASFTTVPTKTVGVETQFGKPGSVLGNGWHWKTPTSVVHKFDASLQSDHYSSEKEDDGDPIAVRLFTGSVAKLNVTFQWRLEDNANFVSVFQNYREPERIKTNLVKRGLQQALNDAFADYNPYAALIAAQQSGAQPGTVQVSATFDERGQKALSRLRAELDPQGVQAVALTIASIEYDGATQANLDKLSAAIAATQVALQNEATAKAQAAANQELNSTPPSAATLTQNCLNVTLKTLEEGHTLPPGWTCMGPSGVVVTTK